MRQSRGLLAASVAAASFLAPALVAAEPTAHPPNANERNVERPRYYFPRAVKRQIGNFTSFTPTTDSQQSDFSSLISKILTGADSQDNANADTVTTVVVRSTSIVVFNPTATPAPAPESSEEQASTPSLQTETGGRPLPVIVPSASPDPEPEQSSSSSAVPPVVVLPTSDDTEDAGSSTGGLPPFIVQPSNTRDPSTADDPRSTAESSTGILVGLSTVISSQPSSVVSTRPSSSSSTEDVEGSIPSGIFPSSAAGTGASGTVSSSAPTSEPVSQTTASSPPSIGDILSSVVSQASSVLSELTEIPTPTSTPSDSGNSSTPVDPTPTSDPFTLIPDPSSIVSSIISDLPTVSDDLTSSTPLPDNSTVSATEPPLSTPTDISEPPSSEPTDSVSQSEPTSEPTVSAEPTSGTEPPISTEPTPSSEPTVSESSVIPSAIPSTIATPAPPASSPVSTPVESSEPVFSVVPTGTDTLSTQIVPSSIVGEPTSNTVTLTSVETGIPSSMPKIIQPPGGKPDAPNDATLVQVGFTYPLNYPFVSSNPTSRRQIFRFLPEGIAYGLDIPTEQVTFYALQPYDTTADLRYITTLALFYVSSDKVSQLSVDLHSPVSKLYSNPNESIQTLMGLINPSIPLLPGQLMDGSQRTTGANNPSASDPSDARGGSAFDDGAAASKPVKSTSVAVGVSAAVGAVLYGGAMVLVARRYKQRKARHQRASSISHGTHTSGPWMTGGAYGRYTPEMSERDSRYTDHSGAGSDQTASSHGRSIRTTQISAPVMSENSLGWN